MLDAPQFVIVLLKVLLLHFVDELLVKSFLLDLLLFALVLVCWFYVLYAGREATLRYLEKIDFSEPVERITVLQLMKHSENTNSTAFIAN